MKKKIMVVLLIICMFSLMQPMRAITNGGSDTNTSEISKTFNDVSKSDWFYDSVMYAVENNIFSGTGESTFSPGGNMTRAMYVTVMGRIAGIKPSDYSGKTLFVDVDPNVYYAPFVAWAYENKITTGIGNNKFGPNGMISREQMAVFTVNYFDAYDIAFESQENIKTTPKDLSTVSNWAQSGVIALWKAGLLTGDESGKFNPIKDATRAECAAFTKQVNELIKDWREAPSTIYNKVDTKNTNLLSFGTNLGGLSDYGTELPFVDLMHNCRTWYSKDVNNPTGSAFDTGNVAEMTFRKDGYPTHIPQNVKNVAFSQSVATIWAVTDGWDPDQYVILYDGTGILSFSGNLSNFKKIAEGKYTFDFSSPGEFVEMSIEKSDIKDPICNVRIIKAIYEKTYLTQPFNPVWLEKLLMFDSVRFMDWGGTNNWGQPDSYNWEDERLFDWSERQQINYYTWADNKGIPYEMMIKLMNDYDIDGWVCVPHRASNDYITKMAQLFRDGLEPERLLTVEYSNEIWNWMFGQTQWLNKYGCEQVGKEWPEGIVPYIQNCLDIWTKVYGENVDRIVRTVGLQTAWLDVSYRVASNMRPESFDTVSPAYYFGLSEEADAALDLLGSSATVNDIAKWVRTGREQNEKVWLNDIKSNVADKLNVPMTFYEGGQHITPTPFGEEPTYAQALIDIQRDEVMYDLYMEWFSFLETLQSGKQPLQCMNFSLVGGRSAWYGSWGILETMNQDFTRISAPKYKAIKDYMETGLTK